VLRVPREDPGFADTSLDPCHVGETEQSAAQADKRLDGIGRSICHRLDDRARHCHVAPTNQVGIREAPDRSSRLLERCGSAIRKCRPAIAAQLLGTLSGRERLGATLFAFTDGNAVKSLQCFAALDVEVPG